jgi:hypothetical protein
MAEALRDHAAHNNIKRTVSGQLGIKHIIEGRIMTPNGNNPYIRSVWIQELGEGIPRLVTAYTTGDTE